MAKDDDVPLDDIKRAPSGRIPQWVIDEARGIPTEPVPWRAPTTPTLAPVRRRSHRWRDRLVLAVVIALVGGYGVYAYQKDAGTSLAPLAAPRPAVRTDVPPPGHEESKQRLLPPAPSHASTSFRFLQHQKDRVTPVTWSPCRPIHYVVRPDYAPAGGAGLLDEGFARLSDATGLRFVNDGDTREAPADDRPRYQPKLYGDRWAPVLVVWATPAEVPDFGIDVVGEAGADPVYTSDGSLTFVSGVVSLDARKFARLVQTPAGLSFARSVILHELGHLAGLAHVNDPAQVMAPGGQAPTYQQGDLAGLSALGSGPCQPSV